MLAHRIELEPEPAADFLGDALDGEGGRGGERERHAERLGGARQRELRPRAPGADAAGRRDRQRQRGLSTQQLDFHVDGRDVHQHLGQQAHALEGGAVLAQRDLVLRAAVEEVEDGARQAPARGLAEVLDAD